MLASDEWIAQVVFNIPLEAYVDLVLMAGDCDKVTTFMHHLYCFTHTLHHGRLSINCCDAYEMGLLVLTHEIKLCFFSSQKQKSLSKVAVTVI